jgi:group I intron endonuclease
VAISGVYQILNTNNDKRYIGSAVDIDKRGEEHLNRLRKGTHINKHLQSAFNKYSENAFKFMILEAVMTPEDLIPLEQKYLDELKPEYNILSTAGSTLGYKHTKEAQKKMSKIDKGRSSWKKGKHSLEKTNKKISETLKGKPSLMKGKHYPKMSESQKGNTKGKGNKGKSPSEKTKLKLREALKKYWENRKLKIMEEN